jgi:hypothetical protein
MMTFEQFYFTQKVLEKYDEIPTDACSYEDMYRVAKSCWEEFCDSKYYQFQLNKDGLCYAVEEYIQATLTLNPES